MEMNYRESLKDKQRIVIKIGSSSLHHPETGELDFTKIDVLVRERCDLNNRGKDVVLVSSGAIAVGRKSMGLKSEDMKDIPVKQACAAIGQTKLMMIYEKIFGQYNHRAAQILMTKHTIVDNLNRFNAKNTFDRLFDMGAIPIVNENDTVATYEIEMGDNDSLSAVVSALVGADLLILLSDIDGLYTDDPRSNPEAEFIPVVEDVDSVMDMGKMSTGSDVGTGGMNTKLIAAKIASMSGIDMIIANSEDVKVIHRIIDGADIGTLFVAHKDEGFDLPLYVQTMHK